MNKRLTTHPAFLPFCPLILALSLASMGSQAATDTNNPSEVIVVTGSRTATRLKDTPASIGKISEAALARTKSTFIGEALNQVSGVYMPSLGNEQHSMSIRMPLSMSAYYVYLEDSIPIRPVGIFNHNALYELNLPGAASIEVIKGPASSLYGSNAVGGAVNFLTRPPTTAPEADIAVQASNNGFRRADVELSAGQDDLSWRAAAYHARSDGGDADFNSFEKTSATLRADWRLSPRTLLVSTLTHNRLRTDTPGGQKPSDYETRPQFSQHTFTWRDVRASRLTSTLRGNWNAGGETAISFFARDNDTNQLPNFMIFNTGNTTASGRQNDNHFRSLGMDVRHRQKWHDWVWIVGATLDRSPNDYNEQNLSVVRDPLSGRYTRYQVIGQRRDYQVILHNQAAYSQLEWQLMPTVRLVGGLRHDAIRYDYRNHLPPSATTGAPSETRRFHRTSPKLGAIWNITPALDTYINASQGFIPPEVSSLYGSLDVPNLKPAQYDNFEIGTRYQHGDWRWDLAAYQLSGQDEQVSYTLMPGKSEPRNAGRTRHRGLEFGVGWKAHSSLHLRASGSLATHRYLSYAASPALDYSGKDMPQAPKWIANIEASWRPTEGTHIGLEAQRVSKWWMDNANTARYPGHTLWHLRASQDIGPWQLWTKWMNLGNKRYAENATSSYSGVGPRNPEAQDIYVSGEERTVFVGVRYRFAG
ncbi:outer membrane receptor protein involved in Fe transport [Chitinivorax tropicus]|uniref:Outer membrane receptor protein involved in Fe transport n=1 Tax=Chitinivorax tropicus TaxID=714531 RepID=A0A840MT85_9PROT|nr:TonB-dependent receptor [Chitinivorax tropicus]MBB5019992.1 outer membrane receptor protein involved in Fe transport [Chitinivorax tropicus]